ncbi:MAG: hypothetical protein EON56_02470 [Alphaproteobacteria bacterium]|nr:MAG: hypothetical protein EON56_02470 [Alphaproteobacteria bacterium]
MMAALPIAPIVVLVETIRAEPTLSVSGRDLDSGKRVTVHLSASDDMPGLQQTDVPPVGLVLVLTLTTVEALAGSAI